MRSRRRARGLSRILPVNLVGSRFSSLIFLIVAAVLFFVSTARPDNMQTMRTAIADFLSPALYVVNKPSQIAADYVRTISGLAHLQEENARLLEENNRLRDWYQKAQVLQAENDSLHTLLNITIAPEHKFVTARVIGDSGNTYAKTLLVMAGKANGVDKGHAALSGEGVIGRVVNAGQKTAHILLMTDINARIPILVEGSSFRAIMAGNNNDTPILTHLPPDAVLAEGQRIITSGHGGLFPYGLPVGETVQMADGRWGVRPFADIDRTIFVRLVNRADDPNLIPASP